MRYMHWNWDDYLSCPVSVLERLIETVNEEARKQEDEARRAAHRR